VRSTRDDRSGVGVDRSAGDRPHAGSILRAWQFTLPLARRCAHVVVEGEPSLVQRAAKMPHVNSIANVEFHVANLAEDVSIYPWLKQGFDKLLLDPPRSGAMEVIPSLPSWALSGLSTCPATRVPWRATPVC